MFQTLIASGPQPRPNVPRFVCSMTLHAIVVATAIVSTRRSAPSSDVIRESSVVYIAPQSVPRPLPPLPNPLPEQTAPAPSWQAVLEVPTLSPGTLTPSLPTASDLLGEVVPSAGPISAPAGVPAAASTPWAADSVDEPVEVLHQAPARYPPVLAQAAIPGRVEVEFVVDTLGRAERQSIRTLDSTRPEFEAAARAAIENTRYRPARVRGRAVRQLVRQTLSFRPEGGLSPISR